MNLSPLAVQKFFDNNGDPMDAGLLFTYAAGTSNKVATYKDASGLSLNTNPIALDFRGECNLWLDPSQSYKFVLSPPSDTDPPTKPIWTVDQINGQGPIFYPRTPNEIALGILPVNYSYPEGYADRYQVNSIPGTTDMSTGFQTASLVSLTPSAGIGPYFISVTTSIRSGQHWLFYGTQFFIVGISTVVLEASTVNDWSVRGEWGVTGDNDNSGSISGLSASIVIHDCMRFYVDGPMSKNIKGYGFRVTSVPSTGVRAERGVIHAPQSYACRTGMEIAEGTSAEYLTIEAPIASRCDTGILVVAGNLSVVGGSFTDNNTNVYLNSGINPCHGVFSATHINHAVTYAIQAHNVAPGMTFIGCNIFEGDIWFDGCQGIVIRGGKIAPHNIINDSGGSSGTNFIADMDWQVGYSPTVIGTAPGDLVITGGRGPGVYDYLTGVLLDSPSSVYVLAKRNATSTQSMTSGVAANLLFNTEVFDRRGAYNPATGVFTVPAVEKGVYSIRANCVFAGTAMSVTSSTVVVQINGTPYSLHLPGINSTTRLVINVDIEVPLSVGDTVVLSGTITGTTPTFGDSTYSPTLMIERIA